jgi:queuine tRNA-ribosyltransferase
MQIQMDLGADIIVAMDECTPYHVNKLYTASSMEKSNSWGLRSLNAIKNGNSQQALLAVIQGGIYQDLRTESARFANGNDFHGFAIGGSLGKTKAEMQKVVAMTCQMLDKKRYTHLLGIGDFESIFHGVNCGIDTFDCVTPTRISRHGIALIKGRKFAKNYHMNLGNAGFKDDFSPIMRTCECYTCQNFTRAYLHHLIKAKESLAGSLISIHNIYTMNVLMSDIRKAISEDSLDETFKKWCLDEVNDL